MVELELRAPDAIDKAGWRVLFTALLKSRDLPVRDEAIERVWSWIIDDLHPLEALIARTPEGEPVGLAHFRAFPDPLTAKVAGYLDDLWVMPHHRGSGPAEALIAEIAALAKKRGWIGLQWIAPERAYRARGLFDRLGTRSGWAVYEIDITTES